MRQVTASLLMTVVVFTVVLMLGSALKEVLPLLMHGQVAFGVVAEAFGLLIPFVWVLALPMGMLTATLLIFGRFSADQELTAIRASGISLMAVISPIILLSLMLCGLSALVNMDIGPRSRVAYRSMLLKFRLELSSVQLPEGSFIRDFPGYIFYVGKNEKGVLNDIMVFRLKQETNVTETVRAPRGKLEIDTARQRIVLSLFDGKVISINDDRAIPGNFEEWTLELDMDRKAKTLETKVGDMSFLELLQQKRTLEQLAQTPNPIQKMTAEQMREYRKAWAKSKKDLLSPVIFHMHRQVAFSFACFGFTLVGIPLAIRVHRRETNVGIAIALVLVALYYSFIILGHSLDTRPQYAPHLIVWIPNFVFQVAGAVMLWRANRGV